MLLLCVCARALFLMLYVFLFVALFISLFILFSPCLSFYLPVCFPTRAKKKVWSWKGGEVVRSWEEMREGNCDQNIVYKNDFIFNF